MGLRSIDNAFNAAVKQFGRVDVVSNNAGYGLSGEFESLSEKQIRTQVRQRGEIPLIAEIPHGNIVADKQLMLLDGDQLLWSHQCYS